MKKILSLTFIFLFLFSACKNQPQSNSTTTKNNPQSSTTERNDALTTKPIDLDKTTNNSTKSETKPKPSQVITQNHEINPTENIQNSSPMIIFIGFDELKEIKKAYDTMTEDDFQAYMETEHIDTYMTGMWDYESSTAILNEMCSTYVPVLDNNPSNLSELAFYWQIHQIDQLVFLMTPKE